MDDQKESKAGDRELLTVSAEGKMLATKVLHCESPPARKRGLLGRERISPEEGALLVMPKARRNKKGIRTSIHMIGMRFPVAVAWLDEKGRVVHSSMARPWRPYYASPQPASYVLEMHPVHHQALQRGARVTWHTTVKS
jgi:uncharacterized membrane protein (UPF0127 family)